MRQSWRFLLRKSLPPQSLSCLSYAVFGLGDSGAEHARTLLLPPQLFGREACLLRGVVRQYGVVHVQAMCSTMWWPRSWTGGWQRLVPHP